MASRHAERDAAAETLLDVASEALATLLHDGCLTRPSALDLLAVDAHGTSAVEAAADDPEQLDLRAKRALARIAALAAPHRS
jgi:hypothetical protein